VWAWHGVPVTQQIIERPETLKPEQIFHGTNAEVRRVTFQRLGMKRYSKMSSGSSGRPNCPEILSHE
jgi:hypothetical protein